jgi:hypothetical protein
VNWALYEAPMLLTDKGKPDSTARQVLVVLGEHANEQGRNAHPSVLRIRYATGLDDRTIERALLRLERGSLIEASGRTYSGTRRWTLAMHLVRSSGIWDEMVADAEAVKQLESARRKDRRNRSTSISSGDVRDSASRRPGVSVPMSGTQSADIRDAESGIRDAEPPEPPEPPKNHPVNHPGTVHGGTLPPNPLRLPPAAPSGTDQANSISEPVTPPQALQGDSLPRTRADQKDAPELRLIEGSTVPDTTAPQSMFPIGLPSRRDRVHEAIAAASARREAARRAHRGQGTTG